MVNSATQPHIVLCGCGNIGFRHLQSLLLVKTGCKISIVEPNEAHHDRIRGEISATDHPHDISVARSLPPPRQTLDLLVIATNAEHRFQAFSDFHQNHDVKRVIFEKVLFQSLTELEETAQIIQQDAISAAVNCGRRGFASYHALKDELAAAGPLQISVSGASFGMASNGIHFLDLAEFLTGSELVTLDASQLEAGFEPTKRAGCVEVFGTLSAALNDGSSLSITCAKTLPVSVKITIASSSGTIEIDEVSGQITRDGETQEFEVMRVSNMPYLYEDLVQETQSWLTPYDASARQHHLFITELKKHLGVDTSPSALCPIS